MANSKTDHFTRGLISIAYHLEDHFPDFWEKYPDKAVEALRKAAQQGLDEAYPLTPYLPNDPRSTGHLRDLTFIQAYRYGSKGGSVYVQWRAANIDTGYRYGIAQEFGSNYQNYTTPGTGPGFMEKTWSVIEEMVPMYLAEATQEAIQENAA